MKCTLTCRTLLVSCSACLVTLSDNFWAKSLPHSKELKALSVSRISRLGGGGRNRPVDEEAEVGPAAEVLEQDEVDDSKLSFRRATCCCWELEPTAVEVLGLEKAPRREKYSKIFPGHK